jgi:hypothetical protein
MEPFIRHFVLYPQQDEDGAGHTDGKTGDVDKGKTFILPEIAEGNL